MGSRIGEKYVDWSDEDLSLDTILESVTLYWLTETFPTSIYACRHVRLSISVPETQTLNWASYRSA